MLERRKIVELAQATGTSATLVTLVRAEGSSYRQPGARLLAAPAHYAGTISGGCLEAEVVRKAPWIARDGAVVQRYSTRFDDTTDIPFGLGCGGTVDLLFESLANPEAQALMHALAASLEGRESTAVSFLPGRGRELRRLILDLTGEIVFATPGLGADKIACARQLLPGQEYEGRFVERLEAPQRLLIFGAGDDAVPLTAMAAQLGWSVTVADSRSHLAQPDRFPTAHRVLCVPPAGVDQLNIQPSDAVVLMTHSYELDRELLLRLLPLRPRYLGLLGSRHRSSVLVAEASAMLNWTVEASCERLFAPVGLDIGGDGPEAIALAIVAEVQSVRHNRIGSQRRLTPHEVARQLDDGGTSHYLQTHCALSAG